MERCRGRVRLRPNRDVSGGVLEWWKRGLFLVLVIVIVIVLLVVVLRPRLGIERDC
jgi:hypothetical protein